MAWYYDRITKKKMEVFRIEPAHVSKETVDFYIDLKIPGVPLSKGYIFRILSGNDINAQKAIAAYLKERKLMLRKKSHKGIYKK